MWSTHTDRLRAAEQYKQNLKENPETAEQVRRAYAQRGLNILGAAIAAGLLGINQADDVPAEHHRAALRAAYGWVLNVLNSRIMVVDAYAATLVEVLADLYAQGRVSDQFLSDIAKSDLSARLNDLGLVLYYAATGLSSEGGVTPDALRDPVSVSYTVWGRMVDQHVPIPFSEPVQHLYNAYLDSVPIDKITL